VTYLQIVSATSSVAQLPLSARTRSPTTANRNPGTASNKATNIGAKAVDIPTAISEGFGMAEVSAMIR
jgi:hypothetical protein